MKFLYVGGLERSGTTILGALVARHAGGVALPEAQFKRDLLPHRTVTSENVAVLKKSFRFRLWNLNIEERDLLGLTGLQAFETICLKLCHAHDLEKPSVFIDHTPENAALSEMLLDSDADATLVHVIRDPRAVIASLRRTDWGLGNLAEAIAFWKMRQSPIAQMASKFDGHPRLLTVRYEDICCDPNAVLGRIAKVSGIATEERARATILLPRYTQSQHSRVLAIPKDTENWRKDLSDADCTEIVRQLADTTIGQAYDFGSIRRELDDTPTGRLQRDSVARRVSTWWRARLRRRLIGVDRIDLPPFS